MASKMYTLGVAFVGKNKVSPALNAIQVDATKTAAKMYAVANATKAALGQFKGRGLGLGGLAGGATALFAVQRGIAGIVRESSRFEVANIQFSKLIGNAQLAADTLREMEVFAARTPFEFKQSQEISKGLLAAGVNARQLIPVMTKLGDLGMGDPEKVSQLALAYSKVRMTGKATWRELRMFATAGVPIFESIRNITGKTQEQLESFVRQGKAKFPMLEKALADLTAQGGKFNGMMVNMMSTVPGLWSNFNDILDQVSRRLGATFQPMLKMTILQMTNLAMSAQAWVEANQQMLSQNIGGFLANVAGKLRWAADNFGLIIGRVATFFKWMKVIALAFIGFKVGIAVLGLIATAFQIAAAAALIFGGTASIALAPILAIIAAIAIGIGAVIYGMKKLGFLGGASSSGLLGSLGAEFKSTFGMEMPSTPMSPEGRSSVSTAESNTTTTNNSKLMVSLAEGLGGSFEGDDDSFDLSYMGDTGKQV